MSGRLMTTHRGFCKTTVQQYGGTNGKVSQEHDVQYGVQHFEYNKP